MKKLSVLFLVTVLFNSCELINSLGGENLIEDILNAERVEVSPDDLPQNAQDVLNDNYFDTFIEEVGLADGLGYEVVLSDERSVFFDLEGEELERRRGRKGNKGNCTSIDTTELPTTITDYIATNYPDASLRRAKVDEDGNYIVGVTGHVFLLFDSEGAFVEELEFANRRGGRRGTPVEIADLPTLITDYITNNYTDAEIRMAFTRNENFGVGIITSDEERKMLIFDSEGNFIEEKTCNGN